MKKNKEAKKDLTKLSKADLHIHALNDGKATPEEIVDYVSSKTDLDIIAIADHDEIDAAYEARKIAKQKGYRFEVIIAEEVTAKEGHILALFIKERIKPGMSAKETIDEIHRQKGLAIAAHPLFQTKFKPSMDGVGLINLLKEEFDGVETANATPTFGDVNLKAKFLNRGVLNKAEIGSSDAHIKEAIGMGYTLFPGKTSADLRNALEKCKTEGHLKKWQVSNGLKYFIYYVPTFFKHVFWGLQHGFLAKEPNIVNLPKDFK